MATESYVCRSCGKAALHTFLDLGRTPLADRLVSESQLKQSEPTYPLEVAFCRNCTLVQILETVSPETLFSADYPYYSSFSPALLEHSKSNVHELIDTRRLGSHSFIIELASNDGYLLRHYVERGIPVLGIDPADGPAAAAREAGVKTMNTFFSQELAKQLAAEGKQADVVHANNVLAHVADTNGFVAGLGRILKENGVAVIEVPYVRDLITQVEFDTIYHEHLCYFSLTALDNLFKRHGLYLNDVRELAIHGGSLRLFVECHENPSENIPRLLESERERGIDSIDFYRDFARKVESVKKSLLSLLRGLKGEGKTIAAYGAAAKGSTLINYIDIGTDLVEFVADRNKHKHGRYMPGKHLPIVSADKILEAMPDYLLILAWNFAEEIIHQQAEYQDRGGRFMVPIPEPRILGASKLR